jgi:2-methylcitrate dehydratase
MQLPRRKFLHFAAGAGALPFAWSVAHADGATPSPRQSSLAARLAAYADGLRYDDLDDATVESVKVRIIDALGCGLAAFDEKPVRICRDVALANSNAGVATVIGTRRRVAPDLAAFANGAAIRYLDLNDAYVGRITGHPSDNISACFAVAEAERATAAELITAVALAYEVNFRLIDAFDANIAGRGWDVPVLSLPAVALAAGKLMKLPPDRLEQAVNLAVNDHIPLGQTRAQTLSDWKGIADAEAARNSVFAAMLAREGLTGPTPIFEGKWGFFALVAGSADVDVGAFGRRGVPFLVHQCGLKSYAAHITAQTAIPAAVALAQHRQRELRTGEAARSAHPRVHAQDYREGRPGLRHAHRRRAADAPHGHTRRRATHRAPCRQDARLSRSNVGSRWREERTDAVLQVLWTLEQANDVSSLLGRLAMQP